MTDAEVLAELGSESLLNRVRRAISASAGRIEQECGQREAASPMRLRRLEFDVARQVIAMVEEERR